MNEYHIMDALGRVNEDYILEAMPGKKKKQTVKYRWIAAVAVIGLLFLFFQTPTGAAAVEIVKEQVTSLIETLFPPKDIAVVVEGETEVISQVAGGQEPTIQESGTVTAPGFAIYYDAESYTMTEENGVTYIRHNIESDLPPCEMEIRHVPGVLPNAAAETARQEMLESWENVSEVSDLEEPEGAYFWISAGSNWDSAMEDMYFVSDGRDGAFQITARYFVEAIEGHGVRFAQMVRTFEIIDPS